MRRFKGQTVSREHCPVRRGPVERLNSIRTSQNVFLEDLEFESCEFIGEGLATYGAPIHRSQATNVRLRQCTVNSFFGIGAVFDEIVVDGLRTSRAPVILDACVLRHVVLSGKCGRFLFNKNIDYNDQPRNDAFLAANADFYNHVDWALDITKLNTSGFEIRGAIPSRLIRRNPDEHFIMTREVALTGDWKNVEPHNYFDISVSTFLDSEAEDNLFVAPRQSKNFKVEIEYFHRLKAAGLVS